MYILTPENKTYELNKIPDEVDMRYGVYDYSDKKNKDYYFQPLLFLESFYAPAIVLDVGPYKVQMPLDWSVIVCDETYSDIEIMPLTRLNDRGFHVALFNPLIHMVPEMHELTISNVFTEVKWYIPKLKSNSLMVVPVEDCDRPKCMLFVKDVTKMADNIDISDIFT
jgi:hypothetical protein